MKRFAHPSLVALLALIAAVKPVAFAAEGAIHAELLFLARIQPLFKAKCLACHGDDEAKIKGGLDMRTQASLLAGGDSAEPALIAGSPEKSPLMLAVSREHADWEAMPPKENDRLTAEQVAYLKEWIAAGAPWPDAERMKALAKIPNKWSAEDGIPVKTSGGLDADWTDRKYKPENLWAYQPLKKPVPPPSTSLSSANPIDAFIGARLATDKLAAAPLADRRTLLRRATYDLLGLPPTPEEIAEFLADPEPDDHAFARVVDRLLASPHYGENMARHWLDIVRYADSSGLANDFARGNTWRYRDYIIRAFNTDKPYDQFITEQIAGDELVEQRSKTETSDDAIRLTDSELIVATGFLRMGPWELTAMEVPKVARQKFLDDVTDSVGQVFLAHPMQCARCHDHKFDPIPTRDYYSFQALFATTQLAERRAPFLPAENTAGFEEKKYLQQRDRHLRTLLNELDEKSIAGARAWYAEKKFDPAAFEAVLEENSGKKGRGDREAGFTVARAAMLARGIPEEQIPPKGVGFEPADYGVERMSRKGLERLKWEMDRYEPVAFAVYSGRTPELKTVTAPLRMPAGRMSKGDLEQTHILTGGDPFAGGAEVVPGVLSAANALGGIDGSVCHIPTEIVGRRTALARWITDPKNPLTARVMANRLWQWHLGTAIAGNPNNFGTTGKKPTHPELLDWLAATFSAGDATAGAEPWSIKAMHRIIMNSETYRRASQHPDPETLAAADPNGTSYAVFKPRRLTAEELRDTMLVVSGELNPAVGGIPARPEINREAALQPRQVMGTFAEAWQPSPKPEQRHRRSIYALRLRGQLDPFMEVFNSPNPDLSCEIRDASTVTPQVFAMFNSEASLDRAVAFAARVRREAPSTDTAIARALQLAFGRPPRPDEMAACVAHVDTMLARHRTLTFERHLVTRDIVREAVEENTGEKFTFTEQLEVASDFVPDLKMADVPVETRALADLCLVLLNTNEFAYVY